MIRSNTVEKVAQNHVQAAFENHQGQAGHCALTLVCIHIYTGGRQAYEQPQYSYGHSRLAMYVHSPGQLTVTQHCLTFGTGAAFMWPCEWVWTAGSCDEGLVPQTQILRNRLPRSVAGELLVSSCESVEGAQWLSFSKGSSQGRETSYPLPLEMIQRLSKTLSGGFEGVQGQSPPALWRQTVAGLGHPPSKRILVLRRNLSCLSLCLLFSLCHRAPLTKYCHLYTLPSGIQEP